MNPTEQFKKLGLALPPAPKPVGVYKPLIIVDKWVYVSGHGPVQEDGSLMIGKVGTLLNEEEGKRAAQQVGLAILSTLIAQLGSLDRIKRVVKVLGMVYADESFTKHPYVINGCSELFAAVWGTENGIGARSAVGMGSLPDQIPVEIEAIFEMH
jgi:enamine deaminase RidA (YjgF/YER057c/UK114 family)